MKNEKHPLPGTNRQRAKSVSSAHTQSATSPEIVTSAGRSGVPPCGTYYVLLCGDLSERLEDLADRRGVLLEDLAAELIEDGLIRESIMASLLNRGEQR
ncbi:hypothetical protein [Streptomyces sp. NPDC051554]|uniref:hypothetical protein n=1 Tax=Streptomyces sp. NPDC051554 TaxID=3365656 RepID=UPI0037BAE316